MPVHARSGVACSLLVTLMGACSTPPATAPIGTSAAVDDGLPTAAHASRSKAPPELAAALTWPEAAPAALARGHRRDGSRIHVRVDPAVPSALAAYRLLAVEAPMPEGMRIIAWHETPAGVALGGYLLAKSSGVWSAIEVDAVGNVIAADGARCVRCHDMAPCDHLFGPPRGESIESAPR
jgi:hypothetical protein